MHMLALQFIINMHEYVVQNIKYCLKHVISQGTQLVEIVATPYISLKVLTDHSNWEARVGLFDPYWQTGGPAIFFI